MRQSYDFKQLTRNTGNTNKNELKTFQLEANENNSTITHCNKD